MINKNEIVAAVSKAAIIGTLIVFTANIVCLAAGHLVFKGNPEITNFGVITIILAIVGLTDLAAAFIIKRKLLAPLLKHASPDMEMLQQIAMKTTITVSALCAALPLYGLISLILEGNKNSLVGFAMVSLAGFMFLRIRPGDFDKLKING